MNNNLPPKPAQKQVILVRVDLEMSLGKLLAQVNHACMGSILLNKEYLEFQNKKFLGIPITEKNNDWFENSFTKTILQVNSEEELRSYYKQAIELGLPAVLIEDNGRTEFNGVKTATTVGIGPDNRKLIDKVTGRLPLLKGEVLL